MPVLNNGRLGLMNILRVLGIVMIIYLIVIGTEIKTNYYPAEWKMKCYQVRIGYVICTNDPKITGL